MLNKISTYVRGFGAFSAGALLGTIYGSVIATITCVALIGLP